MKSGRERGGRVAVRVGGLAALVAAVASLFAACAGLPPVERRAAVIELRSGGDGLDDAGRPVAEARLSVAPTYLFVAEPGEGGEIVQPSPEGAEFATSDDAGTVRIRIPVTHPARITVYAAGEPVRGITLDWDGRPTDWLPLGGDDPDGPERAWIRVRPRE